MFKRIKNLLDISKYSVDQVVNREHTPVAKEEMKERAKILLSSSPNSEYKLATIINMQTEDPFKDITNETFEQSPDDSTPRN